MIDIYHNMRFTPEGSTIRGILSGYKKDLIVGEESSHDIVKNNLLKGLSKIGYGYSYNNYVKGVVSRNINCIIGSVEMINKIPFRGGVAIGPAFFSHPRSRPNLLKKHKNIIAVIVPSNWVKEMFNEWWGGEVDVRVWPSGIDTEYWKPITHKNNNHKHDFLIYDKIHFKDSKEYLDMENFEEGGFEKNVSEPIKKVLEKVGYNYKIIKYGEYNRKEFLKELNSVHAAIYLSTNETQGLAYQEMLSTNTPVLAWNRGGMWKSRGHYPQIEYNGVSSVPYWSEKCGLQFKNVDSFQERLNEFCKKYEKGKFYPRRYVNNNLSLEKSAKKYVSIIDSLR